MPSYNETLEDLGGKQKKIYFFIKSYLEEYGYPPSVRDICEAVGLSSTSTVHGHLNRLEKKGLIKRDHSKTRAIGLNDIDFETRSKAMAIPVVGRVTAGAPILAVENIEEYLPFPANFVRDENSFVLQVRGESMIDAGILDGDCIIVRQQTYADDGEIVVALIEDEATVKRFFHDGKRIRLQPENPTMEPMYFDEVTILGKVTGLFRRIK